MNIAVFASGSGTNAEALIRRFNSDGSPHRVALVVTNRAAAPVIDRARRLGVETLVIPSAALADEAAVRPLFEARSIAFIALAGFLAMIPGWMVDAYAGRIVNLHPSLLPRHCGRGMWGRHVHEAVLAAGDAESGITIHRVDADYDTGAIIFQSRIPVTPDDTPDTLQERIHVLEHRWYPAVVDAVISRQGKSPGKSQGKSQGAE